MRTADRVLALAAAAATLGLSATAVVLSVVGSNFNVSDIGWLGGQTAFSAVGALILFRRPRNLVGRILAASGNLALLQACLWRYAILSAPEPPVGAGLAAAWLADWVYVPMFPLFMVVLPLFFPNGTLLSRRWRPVVWATLALTAFTTAYMATAPGELGEPGEFGATNPASLPVTARIAAELDRFGGDGLLMSGFSVLAAAAAVSVVLRYRRSGGVERLQLKWFVWAIGSFIGYMLVQALLLEVILNRPGSTATDLVGLLFLLGVPASIGIAVLRYRLYDIDRIVSRTVSYALLTLLLGGIYLMAVTGLTAATATRAGDSPVAVAAATLLAAAAFGPTRRRIQSTVDRRFNRARYNAERTLQHFASRMRDEVDLEDLTAELHAVSATTVQPSATYLWIRGGTG